jgi:Universal stress protein family
MLFATDFSKECLAALPYAFSLAEEDQSQVALLHVVGLHRSKSQSGRMLHFKSGSCN